MTRVPFLDPVAWDKLLKANRKAAKKAHEEYIRNLPAILEERCKQNEPVDLNGRPLYPGG